MAIIRLNFFEAAQGKERDLQKTLDYVCRYIQGCQGNISCVLLNNQDSLEKFIVHEVWENVEDHARSLPYWS